MSGRCTIATILEAFDQLQRVGLNRPRLPRDIGALAEAYLEQLKDLPPSCITQGALDHIREGSRYWPTVAELRKAALTARRGLATQSHTGAAAEYWAWEKRGRRTDDGSGLAPCPTCDAVHEPTGRLILYHDHQRHVEAGVIPYVRDQGT